MSNYIKSNEAIKITSVAREKILSIMELDQNSNIYLRIGIKQGGCSGMSYFMNFESKKNILETDEIFNYDKIKLVCDVKSLLYLYGLSLDYSDKLVGGGFKFINPNATQTCGCGQSFST